MYGVSRSLIDSVRKSPKCLFRNAFRQVMSPINLCCSAFSIIGAVSKATGIGIDELNTDFGRFFLSWVRENGHDKVQRLPNLPHPQTCLTPCFNDAFACITTEHCFCPTLAPAHARPWGQLRRFHAVRSCMQSGAAGAGLCSSHDLQGGAGERTGIQYVHA